MRLKCSGEVGCLCGSCAAVPVMDPLIDGGFPLAERSQFLQRAYVTYRSGLHRYFTRNLNDKEEAWDLVQETYLRLSSYDGLSAVRSMQNFLYTMATNILRDHYRRRSVRPQASFEIADDLPGCADLITPERILEGRERLRLLRQALDRLDPRHRRALMMHRLEACSHREIAATLGVTERTVQSWICAALEQISSHARERR